MKTLVFPPLKPHSVDLISPIELPTTGINFSHYLFNTIDETISNKNLYWQKLNLIDETIKKTAPQTNEIIRAVNNIPDLEALEQGPINKSQSTHDIETLLHKIDEHTSIDFDGEHYMLLLTGETQAINLSFLINNANFSHLVLSDDLIEKLAKILTLLDLKKNTQSLEINNPILSKLPAIQKLAIEIYCDYGYQSINRFSRQEKLENGFIFLSAADNKTPLLCFILNCLINDALNKILVLTPSNEGKAVLQRGEYLSVGKTASRTSNPAKLPSITSFSALGNGVSSFHGAGTTRTIIHDAPVISPFGNEQESEVIFPQGMQIITTQTGPLCLSSTFVRSPALEPSDHYLSDLALKYAFDNYLSKEYKDEENSSRRIFNKTIQRPNHGLAHTARVMDGIELVTHYFARHASCPEFKAFCLGLSAKELQWLRIAATFSVTGRESEASSRDPVTKALAMRYRQASADNFLEFANKSSLLNDENMQADMHDIILYMGNPAYENELNKQSCPHQKKKRDFYFRILTIAHKLDLVRCYTKSQYDEAMKLCIDLSHPSEQQDKAYQEMVEYFIALNKAHGDCIMYGEHSDYQSTFAKVSLSIKQLKEETQTVPKPKILFEPLLEALPNVQI
ncbi:MAG: SidE phosphodiesterase domain-containing protein [Legionellales bacterium]|jgi:hypothetical protein